MMKMTITRGFAAGLLLFQAGAHAANWYVRPGGGPLSQTGATWSNAWDSASIAWASVSPGDTIWLAGGTYTNSIKPSHGGSASAPIFVKRVQASDTVPAAARGWTNAFDAQVVIAPASAEPLGFYVSHGGDYTYWDGRVDSGISLVVANALSATHTSAIDLGESFGGGPFPPNNNLVFTNLECAGPYYTAVNAANGYNCYATGIYFQSCTNITIAACRIHGFLDGMVGFNASYVLFDHCFIYDIKEVYVNNVTTVGHANIIEPAYPPYGYFTWRYCRFWNWDNEGIQATFNPVGPITIYGCVFENSGGWGRVIEPRYSGTSYAGGGTLPQGPVYFYNNTCVNCNGGLALGVANPGVWSSGDNPNGVNGWNPASQIRNNIYWNCTSLPSPALADYDYSDSPLGQKHGVNGAQAAPFLSWYPGSPDYLGTNYHLVSIIATNYPRNAGTPIANTSGNTFNVDMDGTTRGADGLWDIGAYEYNLGTMSTNPAIFVAPTGLFFGSVLANSISTNIFTVSNAGAGTLAGTATVAAPFSVINGGAYSLAAGQSQTILITFAPGAGNTASTQTVTFTGGGGATATVIGN
jgi:hypothetical protein